jgi:tetratricopeptide (TPR) repeat protein
MRVAKNLVAFSAICLIASCTVPKVIGYLNQGIARMQMNDPAGAIAEFNKAIEIDPNYYLLYFDRGNAYLAQENWAAGIEDFTTVLKLNPSLRPKSALLRSPDIKTTYYLRGFARNKIGDYRGAEEDLTKAIELQPEFAPAYVERGNAYYHKGQYDQAIADYTKALGINPTYAEVYNSRAVAYYLLKDYDRAWDDVYKAQGLGYQIRPPAFLKDLREGSGRQR